MHALDAAWNSASVGGGCPTAASRVIWVRLTQSRSFSAASRSSRSPSAGVNLNRPGEPPIVSVTNLDAWVVTSFPRIDAPIE
jgi:hypothetical protein